MATPYSITAQLLFPPTRLSPRKLKSRLAGKTVLITGASYGIGECLARMLAATGVKLVLVARTEEKLNTIKEELSQSGADIYIIPADLSKPEDVQRIIDFAAGFPGGVDYLINNAGKSIRRSINDSLDRYHDFTRSMAVNYFGPVQLALALIPVIKKNKGHIINVSAASVLLAPAPYWSAYQSSKSAFDQWFRSVAPELNAAGVHTTSIYFPLVRTRMIAPTAAYDQMPAMSARHAAKIIAKAIITGKRKIAPWWLVFGQLGSVLLRSLWEYAAARYIKKQTNNAVSGTETI
jgi:short-subunit dehydrogenase